MKNKVEGGYQNFQLRQLDGYLFNNYNNRMISRIAPLYRMMFPIFAAPKLFYFSTEEANGRKSHAGYEYSQALSQLKSLRQVLLYMAKLNVNQNQNLQAMKRLYNIRHTARPWEKIYLLGNIFKNTKVEQGSAGFISDLCGLLPLIIANSSFDYNFYNKVQKRVYVLLQKPELLTDENIINFSIMANQLHLWDLTIKLNQILLERVKTIKIKDFQRYIEMVAQIKSPNFTQKQTFTIFCEKINSNIQTFTCKVMSVLYYNLRLMNHKIWQGEKVQNALKEAINSKLYELDEKQINNILFYRSELNIFHKLIYNQLIDSIEEDGTCPIDSQTFFKILSRIYLRDHYFLSPQKEKKLMKFLTQNLSEARNIVLVIQGGLLSLNNKINLMKQIQQSEYKDKYNTNLRFVYEALSTRKILKIGDLDNLINSLEKKQATKVNNHINFILEALVVDLLATQNPEDARVKSLHSLYKQQIGSVQLNQRVFLESSFYLQSIELLVQFKKKYAYVYVDKIIQQQTNSSRKISQSRLNYLFLTMSLKEVLNLVRARKDSVNIAQVLNLMSKINLDPSPFADRFNFINKLAYELLNQQVKNKGVLINYLCNYGVHVALKPNEIYSFLNLAKKFITQSKIKGALVLNFIANFLDTPSKIIKNYPGYRELLEKAVQLIPPSEINYSKYGFFHELAKFNLITINLASQILKSKNKFPISQNILRYCEVIINGTLQLEGLEMNAENLQLISKSNKQIKLKNHLPAIKEAIKQLKDYQLDRILFGFDMMLTYQSMDFANELLKSLLQRSVNKQNPRLNLVLEQMSKFGIQTGQYKSFLQHLVQTYSKNIRSTHPTTHSLLIRECLNKRVKCAEYLEKLIQTNLNKTRNGQNSWAQFAQYMEYFMATDAAKSLEIFLSLHNIPQNEKHRFLDLLAYVDFSVPNNKQLTMKVLKTDNEIFLNEGVYQYLLANIPELKQLESKIKVKQITEVKWLRELLMSAFNNQKVPFEQISKYKHEGIKVEDKFIFFSQKEFSINSQTRLKHYYKTIFGLTEISEQNIIVLFCKNPSKFHLATFLSLNLSLFKDRKSVVLNYLRMRSPQKQKSEENIQATSESKEENKVESNENIKEEPKTN